MTYDWRWPLEKVINLLKKLTCQYFYHLWPHIVILAPFKVKTYSVLIWRGFIHRTGHTDFGMGGLVPPPLDLRGWQGSNGVGELLCDLRQDQRGWKILDIRLICSCNLFLSFPNNHTTCSVFLSIFLMFKTDCVSLSLFSLLLSLLFSRFSVLCVFHVLVVARFSFLPVFFHSTSCSEALSCTLLFSVLPFLVVLAFCSVGLVLVEMGKHYANLVPFWRYSSQTWK